MRNVNYSFQSVIDGQGIEISITGMLVVFTALILISFFITLLPHILEKVAKIYPLKEGVPASSDTTTTAEDEVLAAIGFILHTKKGKYLR